MFSSWQVAVHLHFYLPKSELNLHVSHTERQQPTITPFEHDVGDDDDVVLVV